MAISRLAPAAAASTEPIATIKITGTSSLTTLTTPLDPGTYKISSGYAAGSIAVTMYDASNNPISYFVFATSGMFTIASTAAKIGIVAPTGAINGVVDFTLLTRGASATTVGLTTWGTKALAGTGAPSNFSMQIVNGYLYVIGGTLSGSWDNVDGTGVIQRWDMNPANSFSVVYNAINLNGAVQSVAIGNYIYFNRGNVGSAFYRFDTTNNTLTTLTARPQLTALGNLVRNNAGTKIYSFSSYNASNYDWNYVYDIATNAWTRIANMPFTGEWGSGSHRCLTNDDIIFIYGMTNQSSRYRYNITANTYTIIGGSSFGMYTNFGAHTPNGNYYLYAKTPGGSPESQFHVLKNDGSEDAQYIYTPTAAALYRDSIVSGTANNNNGTCVAVDSNNVFVHTNSVGNTIYYTPTAAFLGALN